MAAAVSPSVVLATALSRARLGGGGARASGGGGGSGGGEGPSEEEVFRRFYEEFPLAGEAIAHRIGTQRAVHWAGPEGGGLPWIGA
jgi:hypothetical protein